MGILDISLGMMTQVFEEILEENGFKLNFILKVIATFYRGPSQEPRLPVLRVW